MEPSKSKDLCRECYDDFYNRTDAEQCWSYEDSYVCKKKFVHIDQRPPWTNDPEWTLNCHHRQRYISVGVNVER